jgi:hypothetical protein
MEKLLLVLEATHHSQKLLAHDCYMGSSSGLNVAPFCLELADPMSRAHPSQGSADASSDLSDIAVQEISVALNALTADSLALYMKAEGFHWHVSAPHFRDYHLLFDEQRQIYSRQSIISRSV